ncbi:MAG TPA: hypothetical protein VET24_13965 [Actinomycetota bacterium]|nr:hypothetical protein [Actinomycetota bacterium]
MPENLAPGYGADVPRPPIGFSIAVPDHWTVLDLDPATREEWVDAFLDERLAGRPRAAQERPAARRGLLELLAHLQSGQVFMAAILAGEVEGQLLSASATLAWRNVDGNQPIPLEGLRRVYAQAAPSTGEDPSRRRVEVVRVSAGGAVKVVTRETMQVPMVPGPRPVDVTQYFVPVLDTPWLAVITTTTGQPQLAPGVEQVADGMASSLAFNRRPAPRPG